MDSGYSKKRYKTFSHAVTLAILTVLLHVARLIEWLSVWLVIPEVICALATLFFVIKYWRLVGRRK